MNLANRGAPPKYKTPEEMQEKIDTYFAECKGEIVYDAYGKPMIDKNGNVVREGACIGIRNAKESAGLPGEARFCIPGYASQVHD